MSAPQRLTTRDQRRRRVARIIGTMIVSGQPYDETKAFATTPASQARRLKNLQNQAQALNMKLVPN